MMSVSVNIVISEIKSFKYELRRQNNEMQKIIAELKNMNKGETK